MPEKEEIKKVNIFKLLFMFISKPSEFLKYIKEFDYKKEIILFTLVFFFIISFPIQRLDYISNNIENTGFSDIIFNTFITTLVVTIVFFLRNYFFYLFYLFTMNFLTLRKDNYINQSVFLTVFTVSLIKGLDTFIKSIKSLFLIDKTALLSSESFREFIDLPVSISKIFNISDGFFYPFLSYITIFHIAEIFIIMYFFSKIFRTSLIKTAIPIIMVWSFIFLITFVQSF